MTAKPHKSAPPWLCIYHGDCPDGFAAAWVVSRALGDEVCFHAGVHQSPPPDTAGRRVIMVDFSYPRAVIESMAAKAKSVLVLDHHKSAMADLASLEQLPPNSTWEAYRGAVEADAEARPAALFDMNRSGAGIAWDFFFGGARPEVIDHIEDRDLWRFAIPGTRRICAAVGSYPYRFATWSQFLCPGQCNEGVKQDLLRDGEAILRARKIEVERLVGRSCREMVIGGYRVPVANIPPSLVSSAGHLMAKGQPFAACYWDTSNGRLFSLRSRPDGLDVSTIASGYGGGGHKHAAGFRANLGWEGEWAHDLLPLKR